MTDHVAAKFPGDGDRVIERRFYSPLDLDHYGELKEIHALLGDWLDAHRLETPGKTYDHDARPADDAERGERCRECGEDVTWIGPDMYSDWLHVDDKENR